MAGIYIHIPFCKQACYYCDFHFSTNHLHRAELCKAIATELALRADYLDGERISTIYWGGGTPSILSEAEFAMILEAVYKNFSMEMEVEHTLETNPDDITAEKLLWFRNGGVNRLSIGIQSFDDAILRFFNRAHSASEAVKSVSLSREAGFENISIDLIYAIPGQLQDAWRQQFDTALSLKPDHISAYSLTIEDKTVFGNWHRKGKIRPANEREAAMNFVALMDWMAQSNFEQYEISNFCRPGFYARHNSNYWKQIPYLGVGPSAHSYNGISRQANVMNNRLYQKAIESEKLPAEIEILTRENKINEYIFTTLRTMWGCDLSYLKMMFNYDLFTHWQLAKMIDDGLIKRRADTIFLTQKGKLVADQISSDLFISE